jgi:ubiquinone/menaquinone biosynthesis C-methylase UbiE
MRARAKSPEIIQAMSRAQEIAFAPFVFSAAVAARRMGVLRAIGTSPAGLSPQELAAAVSLSPYGLKVLTDMLLAAGVLRQCDGRLFLTKTGECLEWDALTGVNLDFTADVCFKPLAHLEQSLRTGRPEGLKEFGDWSTLYEALPQLPPETLKSWLQFDHYYSETAFRDALRHLEKLPHGTVFDIGGNTGRFCELLLKAFPEAKATLIDLPGQCEMARSNPALQGFGPRFSTASVDWLDIEAMPQTGAGADIIWMSQFLDCFSPQQAQSILMRAGRLLAPDGKIVILECIQDNQTYEAAQMSLAATSLYFTAVANGNSRFFDLVELEQILSASSLRVTERVHPIGATHTLFICEPSE